MQIHFVGQLWLAKLIKINENKTKNIHRYITLLVEFPAKAICRKRQTKMPPLSVIKREYKKAW